MHTTLFETSTHLCNTRTHTRTQARLARRFQLLQLCIAMCFLFSFHSSLSLISVCLTISLTFSLSCAFCLYTHLGYLFHATVNAHPFDVVFIFICDYLRVVSNLTNECDAHARAFVYTFDRYYHALLWCQVAFEMLEIFLFWNRKNEMNLNQCENFRINSIRTSMDNEYEKKCRINFDSSNLSQSFWRFICSIMLFNVTQ